MYVWLSVARTDIICSRNVIFFPIIYTTIPIFTNDFFTKYMYCDEIKFINVSFSSLLTNLCEKIDFDSWPPEGPFSPDGSHMSKISQCFTENSLLKRRNTEICAFQKHISEGADRVRGRWEMRGREGGEEGEGGGRRGAGGGRRGGGRREKRGREEGEGRKKGREGEGGKFCAREARAAPEGRRETRGREGGGKGAGGGRGLPPPIQPLISKCVTW